MKKITLLGSEKNRTRKTKRWLGWLTFCMMIFGQMSFAQVSAYSFSQSEGVFTSIATDGDIVTGSEATTGTTNDTSGWTVNIPFSFNFNGGDYTSIFVNSNGGATFGSTTSTASTVISTTTAYDGAIAVMNRDLWGVFITSGVTTSGSDVITDVGNFYGLEIGKQLNNVNGIPSGATVTAFDEVAGTITMSAPATSSSTSAVVRYGSGKVFTKTEGTAPNRVFVIEWSGYNDWATAVTGSNYMSFQLRLEETSNIISIVYGDYYNASTTNRTNQIGLRGATTADYNNRLGAVGNPWNNTSSGTASGSTVSRDNTNFPASGLTFSWSPPACLAPGGLNSSLDSTFTTATLGWDGTASLFDVEWGDVGFTQGSGTVVNNIATNSLVVSPLTPNMSYSFYVRQNCGVDGYSNWAGPYTFYTGYCVPATTGTYYFTNISTTGGDSNISLTKTAKDTGGYGDYSATQIVSGFEGQEIDISMTMNTSTHYFFGWIDLNNDGDFNDAGENIISANTSYSLTYSGTLTIPALPLGDYRIRVGSSWSGVIQPCGSANGEYQDFTLTVIAPPPCLAPTALTATDITYDSAVLGWTSTGTLFDIEIVEEGETPTGTPTYTGVVNNFETTIDLTPSTSYEFYVRQDCGVNGTSTWVGPFSFTTECLPPNIISTTGDTICGQGEATLSATADAGASIGWYAAQTGGAKLAEGATFTTPLISETTSYWVAAATPGNSENVGPVNPSSIGTEGGYSTSLAYVTFFTVTNATTVETVDIFPNSPLGTAGSIIIRDVTNGNTIVGTYPYTVTSTGSTIVAQTVAINQSLPAGNYSMGMETTVVSLYRNTAGATFPYVGADISLTGQGFTGYPEYFYYFYNWSVSSSCSSARTEVIATVTTAPDLVLSETTVAICEGETTDTITITTGASDYDTYAWEPTTGVSGDATNGWTFNPTETTTYTLTASQSAGVCATSIDFVVTVNAAPTVNGITASAVEICEGTSVDIAVNIPAPATYCLVSFPSSVEPITLVEFAGINNATSAAINGTPALEDFTAMVGDVTAGNTYSITVNGNTDGGFTNNFYVYIDWNQNGVFTDPGETYSIGSITNNNGSGTPLIGSIAVPSTVLNGNTRMRVLKKYSASTDPGSCNTTGFGQAEDYTVNVTGGIDLDTYSWSDGTSVVGTTPSLTLSPTATTTYTVTVTASNGCTSTESVEITVNPVPQQPVIACYETATFNANTCEWVVTGEQPEQPVIACYETATFDEVSCAWVVTGTQPAQPTTELACYESYVFNDATCAWEVTGTQPVEPTDLACYESATFDEVSCAWVVTGDQPAEPTTELACYESYVFNDATCAWEVTGTQPVEPTDLACYETATFDEVSCAWVVTGTAPATPTADSPQPMSVGQTVSEIVVTDVTGTLNWYSDEDLTSVVDESTELTEGTHTFWVTQTIDGCESDAIQIVVEVTLSTNVFDNASFRTYPNPVKDFFNVSYSKEITNISVVNMLGQTVLEKAVNATDTQIDMTSLPTGSYFVKVNVEGNSKTVKVIKQ